MLIVLIAAAVIVVALVGIFVGMYNGLVRARIKAEEAWSGITVQLKRRYDLIPNLISAVEKYVDHEKSTLSELTEKRTAAMSAQTVADTAKGDSEVGTALKSILAISEGYPDLKASENYKSLQADLSDTEDKLAAARRFYNTSVTELNSKIHTVPSSIVAAICNFKVREFYEVEKAEKSKIEEVPKV